MSLEPLSRNEIISALKNAYPLSDSIDLDKLSADELVSLYNNYCNKNFGRFDE